MNFHTISIKYMIIYVDKKLATFQFIMKCSVVSRFILDIHFGSIQPFLSFFIHTYIFDADRDRPTTRVFAYSIASILASS